MTAVIAQPGLWLPPKPHIWLPDRGRVGAWWRDWISPLVVGYSRTFGGSGVTALSYVGSATSDTSTITIPGTAAAGDLAVLVDVSHFSDTNTVPSGWTGCGVYSGGNKANFSYKVLAGGDPGSNISGMTNSAARKVMFIYRPDGPISTVASGTFSAAYSSSAPPGQTISCSGQATPIVAVGAVYTPSGPTPAFTTFSPTEDGTTLASSYLISGRLLFNSSPSNVSIACADLGVTGLYSNWINVA